MLTSIIKELSGTKMAKSNKIIATMPSIKQMMNIIKECRFLEELTGILTLSVPNHIECTHLSTII